MSCRRCWNSRTACSVVAPNSPCSSGSIRYPSAPSRDWTSRVASPRAPRRRVVNGDILAGAPFHRVEAEACLPPRSRGNDRSGGDVWLDLPEDRFLAANPHHASLLLTILEHDERGDAHDPVAKRSLRVVVDVELYGFELVGMGPRDLLDQRRDHVAGHAPLRPEINQDRPAGPQDLTVEVLICYLCDVIRHRVVASSTTALTQQRSSWVNACSPEHYSPEGGPAVRNMSC